MANRKPKNLIDGKLWAYTEIELDPGDESLNRAGPRTPPVFVIVICGEGEPGYRPIPDYGPYDDEARARGVAERLNERIGVSHAEMRRIVLSTMPSFHGNQPRPKRQRGEAARAATVRGKAPLKEEA